MATPLSLEEIIIGEIIWGATKSIIAKLIMLGVVNLFGLITYKVFLDHLRNILCSFLRRFGIKGNSRRSSVGYGSQYEGYMIATCLVKHITGK